MQIVHGEVHPGVSQHLDHGVFSSQPEVDFPHRLPGYPILGSRRRVEDRKRFNAAHSKVFIKIKINLVVNWALPGERPLRSHSTVVKY